MEQAYKIMNETFEDRDDRTHTLQDDNVYVMATRK